jgi:hypothetical protein
MEGTSTELKQTSYAATFSVFIKAWRRTNYSPISGVTVYFPLPFIFWKNKKESVIISSYTNTNMLQKFLMLLTK